MQIDTSSYYPKSHLDEDCGEERREGTHSLFPDRNTDSNEPPTPTEKPSGETKPERPDMWTVLLDGIATALSWIFVPLMAPVYGIMLIFGLSVLSLTPFTSRLVFTLEIAAYNLVLPALLILLLKRLHVVDDIGLNGRKERTIPYIITILCMAGSGVFMLVKGAPMWVAMFFMGGALAGLINLVVNFRWKISAHAAAVAGLPAILVRVMHVDVCQPETVTWLMITILVAGLLGSARIWLGRHTLMQVMAGYAVGFFCVFFLTML